MSRAAGTPSPQGPGIPPAVRPWLGLRYLCAGVYTRVYRKPEDTAYNARCPRCGELIRIAVAPGGRNERMFEVDCGLRLSR